MARECDRIIRMSKRDPETIHKTMSAIRGKNTGIERKLRKALTEKGLRYRLYSAKIFGHPDIAFPSLRIAVFCDSEFWHGYRFEENEKQLASLSSYWLAKIRRNIARDEEVNRTLKQQGYLVLRFWGQEIEKNIAEVVEKIEQAVAFRQRIVLAQRSIEEFTTLVYVEQKNQYLLIHRIKEEGDVNAGKWIGIGGHLESGETPTQAMKREVFEESGLRVKKYYYYGYADFLNDAYPPERMYLYKVTEFDGDLSSCDEGVLAWVDKEKMLSLPMWEGDKAFLPYLNEPPLRPFRLALCYHGDELTDVDGPYFPEAPKRKKKKKAKRRHG